MSVLSRRAFLSASLAGISAGCAFGDDRAGSAAAVPRASGLDTLFLTWQRDPTTTMTVQWVGPDRADSEAALHFAPRKAGAAAWQTLATQVKPYPLTDLKLFRVELTGLTPGTDYDFRLGSDLAVYHFRTMPAKATDTIHFVSGGDCGTNAHTIANNIQAARQDPMFALIGGDLGYDDGKNAATSLNFLRNYSQHMIGRNDRLIPMLACIGNHEVQGGYGQPRTKAPFFYSLFDGLFTDTGYATLDFGDYLSLVLLDTGHTSAIGGAQTEWLEKTLRDRQDHPHLLAVNHVPAYPSHRKMTGNDGKPGTGAENRTHWVPLFEKYRVPVVLEHHDHTFKRSKPLLNGLADERGVLYLGDGSWGQLRAPQTPEQLPHLAASSGDYHLSLHRLQGKDRYHLALDERGRVMDVCRS